MATKRNSIKVKLSLVTALLILISIVLSETFITLNFRKTMDKQIETNSLDLAKSIALSMETGNSFSKAIEKQLEEQINTACLAILNMKNVSNESLTELANNMGVTEVAIADKSGVVTYSNLKEDLGFRYKDTSESRKLLNTDTLRISEPVKKSDTDNKYYKYGSATLDHTGFVQVGIEASKVMKLINENSAQAVLDKMDKSKLVFAEVTDKDLKVIAHTDKSAIGKNVKDNITEQSLAEGKTSFKKEKGSYFIAMPYKENNNIVGIVGVSISTKDIDSREQRVVVFSIIIALLLIAITVFVTYRIINKNISPLIELAKTSENISRGDLTKQINISNNSDELSSLSRNFEEMVSNLKAVITDIQYSSNNIMNSSHELASFSEEVSSTSDEISNTIQNAREASRTQVKEVDFVNENVSVLSDKLKVINNIINNLNKSSSVTNELSSTGKEYLISLNSSINDIGSSSKNISSKIQSLNSKSKEISTILQVINSISEQTNLLALNAAIEAARVGDAGKGFAVVADEIRKLAEQSQQSSMKIEDLIKDILNEANETVKVAEESEKIIDEGVTNAKSTEDCFNNIIENVQAMLPEIQKTAEFIKVINDNKDKISSSVDKTLEIANDIDSSFEQIAATAEGQSSSTDELANIAVNLNNLALKLKDNTDKFKI